MIHAAELSYATASDLAARIRRRELSPVELVDACIARIEERNPSINALVYLGFEDARRAAQQAEQAVLAGEHTGPMHGVPTLLKDLFDFKPGWITTFGAIRALMASSPTFIAATPRRLPRRPTCCRRRRAG